MPASRKIALLFIGSTWSEPRVFLIMELSKKYFRNPSEPRIRRLQHSAELRPPTRLLASVPPDTRSLSYRLPIFQSGLHTHIQHPVFRLAPPWAEAYYAFGVLARLYLAPIGSEGSAVYL